MIDPTKSIDVVKLVDENKRLTELIKDIIPMAEKLACGIEPADEVMAIMWHCCDWTAWVNKVKKELECND